MLFGGFQPLTLLDYPGRVACIAFTQGCNLRCWYCHNARLIDKRPPENETLPTEQEIFDFLKKRHGMIDGLVLSGGEPTIQPDLLDFLGRVKSLDLLVKLDTNGTNPHVLREALDGGLLDYVAMDVKHIPSRYADVAGVAVDPNTLALSRDLLLSAGVECEFRTTVIPGIHDETVIEHIRRFCTGASRHTLQRYRPTELPLRSI